MCEYLKMKDCFVIARRIERDDGGMYLLTRLSEENIKNKEYLKWLKDITRMKNVEVRCTEDGICYLSGTYMNNEEKPINMNLKTNTIIICRLPNNNGTSWTEFCSEIDIITKFGESYDSLMKYEHNLDFDSRRVNIVNNSNDWINIEPKAEFIYKSAIDDPDVVTAFRYYIYRLLSRKLLKGAYRISYTGFIDTTVKDYPLDLEITVSTIRSTKVSHIRCSQHLRFSGVGIFKPHSYINIAEKDLIEGMSSNGNQGIFNIISDDTRVNRGYILSEL